MVKPNSRTPHLTKGTKEFVDKLEKSGAPPLYTLTPQEAREVLNQTQSGNVRLPEVEREDLYMPVGPSGRTAVRIIRPVAKKNEALPYFLFIHGGGWIMGNKDTHNRLVSELAAQSGRAAVFVDYPPSPEARYPEAVEQAYAVLEHLDVEGRKYSLSGNKPIVVGDSVGGNMSLAASLMSQKKKGPKLERLVLFYPVTDANFETESYNDFAEGPWPTNKAMQLF